MRRQRGAAAIFRLAQPSRASIFFSARSAAIVGRTSAQAAGAGAASAGLSACASRPAGKETRDCVAAVLETLAAQQPQPERKEALLRAASGLRAAVNKAQAVLAITACYNVISAALKQASASGKGVRGMGGAEGLGLIAGVVARAVRLIQAKG